jgi:RNA polymerase sigma-70 factor, ECF subfamily
MVQHDTDLALARRVVAGDRQAFDRLFDQVFARLYRFVLLRVGRDADAAQDICQSVMERAVTRLAQYRGEASLFTWFCTIARHEIADHWERLGRHRQQTVSYDQDEGLRHALESLQADPAAGPEAAREQRDLRLLVQTVLDHLPTDYGDALEWKYVDGLDAATIGRRLDLSPVAAHSLVARARRAFRAEFEAILGELAAGTSLENPR